MNLQKIIDTVSALVFNNRYVEWMLLSFPLWVLLVSLFILWDRLHSRRAGPAALRAR